MAKHIRILVLVVICTSAIGNASGLFAQTVLSGSELENACRVYASKAVNYANEWDRLDCLKKLNVAPQLFNTDRNYHYLRCRNSVGTTIASDLQSMDNELKPCRSVIAGTGIATPPTGRPERPERPPVPDPRRDPRPTPEGGIREGDLWDIIVINSADLGRSEHSFRIPSIQGRFTARNTRPGGPDFSGQVSGSVFEGLMTDRTGYRASLIGHLAGPARIEGTGCDNRGRSYSFTMTRR